MPDNEQERVEVVAAAVGAGAAAGRVLIAPWGRVQSSNGDFIVDGEAGQLVVEAFEAHATDLPIDYEHQSLGGTYASPSGQAPAAGWIKSLRVVTPEEDAKGAGLFAEVEWTAGAREKLEDREYRYLSPVVIVRKRDRRMVALHSAALTNKPAIVGMRPIVNREGAGDSVGTCEGGNAETCEGANAGTHDGSDAVEVLRLRLGLEAGCDGQTVMLAAERRLAELMGAAQRREAEQRVADAMRAGKLIPVQQEWAMALALRDPAEFDAWAATAPVVVSLGRTQPPAKDRVESGSTAAIAASARAAYRAEPSLAAITSEEAWVAQAVREGEERRGERGH